MTFQRGLFLTFFLIAICIIISIIRAPFNVTWDVAVHLDLADRVLNNQVPQIDFFEINFPTITYLSIVPMIISDVTGLNPLISVQIIVLLVIALCCLILLRLGDYFIGSQQHLKFIVPFIVMLYSYYALHNDTYGQREMIFILFYLPFFYIRMIRWQGQSISPLGAGVAGFFAAMATSIKPFFAIIPILTEIYWFMSQRHHRKQAFLAPEIGGFIAFTFIFVAYFLMNPEILANILDMLALSRQGYAAYYYIPPLYIFNEPLVLITTIISIITLAPINHGNHSLWFIGRGFSVLALCGVVIYIVQGKGFDYHRIIHEFSLLVVLSVWFISPLLESANITHRGKLIINMILASVVAFCGLHATTTLRAYYRQDFDDVRQVLREYTESGDYVLSMTPYPANYPNLLALGLREAGSYTMAYPYLMAYHLVPDEIVFDDSVEPPTAVQDYLQITANDIVDKEPSIIFITIKHRRFWEYLQKRGFIDKHITPDYRRIAVVDEYITYIRR